MSSTYTPEQAEKELTILEVGNRLKIGVKTLNGAELRAADLMSRGTDVDRAMCRAAYAVRKINDELFAAPRSDSDLMRVMGRFQGQEWDAFAIIYAKATQNEVLEEQIKNLLAPTLPEQPAP